MPPNGLAAYFFDLDGTLYFHRPSGLQAFLDYGRDLGLAFTPEAVRRTHRWQHQFWADRAANLRLFEELGEVEGWREVMRRQLCLLDVSGPLDEYVQAIQDRFAAHYQPEAYIAPETPAVLLALRQQGYVTGLVSNRNGTLGPAAEEYGLAGLFDFMLSAEEAGSWKPEPGIFRRALELAGVPAGAAVYVGDNYYADVLGAQGAGLRPILYDPAELFPEADCRVICSLGELLEL
jgi:HAD superfamily hydrolase (TIGR01509 family)